jgi:phospholipid/cholesterol/gamma-HCH transport system substrate-binding protein
MRTAVIELSQAISAFGDHSDDVFSTVKDLSVLVSALQSSTVLMRELNSNFAAVTRMLANDPARSATPSPTSMPSQPTSGLRRRAPGRPAHGH